MKTRVVLILTLACLLTNCKQEKDVDATLYYDVPTLSTSFKNTIHSIAEIDTLKIQSDIETSYVGDFKIFNDTLYFADRFFGYLFRFTKEGNLIDRNIGKGRGPNEILGFNYFFTSDDGYNFLNGGNSNLSFFNKKFEKEKEYRVNWEITRSRKEILSKPLPEIGDSYEFDFGIPNIFKFWDKEHVAITITASHPKFNGYFDSELYYNYSRVLAIVNINTGKIDRLIGRRSPIYLLHKNIPNFDHLNYEVTKENVFVNFWADSTIYKIDKETGKAVGKFGKSGKNMNTNYPTTNSYDAAEENWRQDIEQYGYYNYMVYIEDTNTLYRGYTKGDKENTDGLQVYKDFEIVGDISVPKGLEIIGAINEDIYAINALEENQDELKVYKIKFQR